MYFESSIVNTGNVLLTFSEAASASNSIFQAIIIMTMKGWWNNLNALPHHDFP